MTTAFGALGGNFCVLPALEQQAQASACTSSVWVQGLCEDFPAQAGACWCSWLLTLSFKQTLVGGCGRSDKGMLASPSAQIRK